MQHHYGQYNQQQTWEPPVLPHFRDKLVHPILKYNGELNIRISDYSHCFYCMSPVSPVQGSVCGNCGFPQGGTPYDQQQYLAHKRILFTQRESIIEQRRTARNMIFFTAGVYLLFGLLGIVWGYGVEDDIDNTAKFFELLITVGAFAGLGILAHQYSWWGVVLSLATLSLHMMMLYFLYGLWLFMNIWILLKLASALGLVIYSFYLVNEANDMVRKLNRYNIFIPGE